MNNIAWAYYLSGVAEKTSSVLSVLILLFFLIVPCLGVLFLLTLNKKENASTHNISKKFAVIFTCACLGCLSLKTIIPSQEAAFLLMIGGDFDTVVANTSAEYGDKIKAALEQMLINLTETEGKES